jgi:hypothetical protein
MGGCVTWSELAAELDDWASAGRRAEFWWRDDDAVADTPELDRLLLCAGPTPVALAVIPALVEESLPEKLAQCPTVSVLQHGWWHHNHAAEGPNSEYPAGRDLDEVATEFTDGRRRLSAYFPDRYIPVFAPPWHGFDDSYVSALEAAGLSAISRKGARPSSTIGALRLTNIHCVPILWTDPPSFDDDATYLRALLDHLRGKRNGGLDPDEPTGILTHHLVQNDRSYEFMSTLAQMIWDHRAATWLDARHIFGFDMQ